MGQMLFLTWAQMNLSSLGVRQSIKMCGAKRVVTNMHIIKRNTGELFYTRFESVWKACFVFLTRPVHHTLHMPIAMRALQCQQVRAIGTQTTSLQVKFIPSQFGLRRWVKLHSCGCVRFKLLLC